VLSDAQATIMLTPRFPLYLFGVYIALLYLPIAMAWRLQLSPVAEAALAALLGCCVYSPWDVVGARLIWWTWHDTDLVIANRLLGVPCASTVWQLCFCFCYCGVLRIAIGSAVGQDVQQLTFWRSLRTFVAAQLLPVPGMLLLMQAAFLVGGVLDGAAGLPPPPATPTTVRSTEAVFLALAAHGISVRFSAGGRKAQTEPPAASASLLNLAFIILVGFLFSTALVAAPEHTFSTGVHQTFGPCGVPAVDLNGLRRNMYICAAENSQVRVELSLLGQITRLIRNAMCCSLSASTAAISSCHPRLRRRRAALWKRQDRRTATTKTAMVTAYRTV
jgi:hypothetical protein